MQKYDRPVEQLWLSSRISSVIGERLCMGLSSHMLLRVIGGKRFAWAVSCSTIQPITSQEGQSCTQKKRGVIPMLRL
jgi:hypothetical protein